MKIRAKKPKVYISGPMTGYDNENKPAFFEAEEKLKEKYTVVNPARNQEGLEYAEYIKIDVKNILKCDALYLLPGWQYSTGARLEHELAVVLKLDIFYPQGG